MTASVDATLEIDGLFFRDLDHDGQLAPYEDWRLPNETRVDDLLSRMTIDEQVATLLHGTATAAGSPLGTLGVGTNYDLDALHELIVIRGVTSMISRLSLAARDLAEQNNRVQALAATGRLGIPLTFSTDPRHHANAVLGAGVNARTFSVWPDPLGLGAVGSRELARRFGHAVRSEYRSVGFHMALSPQADLATSPRWPRIDGTFGEDPDLVRSLVGGYIEGAQGGANGLAVDGVACIVKHWVGYGASKDGFDGHNYYGRFSAFPGGAFGAHIDAFRDAFSVGVAGVMPTYNILEGLELRGTPVEAVEAVGAGFSEQLLNGLLRSDMDYDGLIVSDWAIMRSLSDSGRTGVPPQAPSDIAMPWGVDGLTPAQRYAKGLNAGLDQFGGEDNPEPLLEALRLGLIDAERVRASARRVLLLKFQLGLFDNPFVDVDAAATVVGAASFVLDGAVAQAQSLTPLVVPPSPPDLSTATVYLHGIEAAAFTERGVQITKTLSDATLAIVLIDAPYEVLHPTYFFGGRQHEGSLDYPPGHPDLLLVQELAGTCPTIVVVRLDRPAILEALLPYCHGLYGDYGADATAIADALTGKVQPIGRLPFQISRSMEAVLSRPCDLPRGDANPRFDLGYCATAP